MLKEIVSAKGSVLIFDRGCVDYATYEKFTQEYDIPQNADSRILKDEEIRVLYGENRKLRHRSRSIAYRDSKNNRLFVFCD
ncbi:hypothetical protein AwDysgo_02960 [Bacteroidales bacterium]|nr:hypothetical protein AwDysgo_02960 [Bacteroidales bacterium]